ncbi:hypothetical protein [Pseudarthrobacter siccitolerans]
MRDSGALTEVTFPAGLALGSRISQYELADKMQMSITPAWSDPPALQRGPDIAAMGAVA